MKMRKNTWFMMALLGLLSLLALGGCGGGGSPDALAQFQGNWASFQTYLDNEEMKPAYEKIAAEVPGYSPDGVKGFVEDMSRAEVSYHGGPISLERIVGLKVEGDVATFTLQVFPAKGGKPGTKAISVAETKTISAKYASEGDVPMPGFEDHSWHQFQAVDGSGDAYKYFIATDVHSDTPDSMKHWHFRFGNKDFGSLVNSPNPMWFPTFVAATTTKEEFAEDMREAAGEYAEIMKTIPPLMGWKGEWIASEGFLDDPVMEDVYKKIAGEAEKMGKNYTPDEVKAFLHEIFEASFSGMKIDGTAIAFLNDKGEEIAKSTYDYEGLKPVKGHGGHWRAFKATGKIIPDYTYLFLTRVHGLGEGDFHMRYGKEGFKELGEKKSPNWGPTFVRKGTKAEAIAADYGSDEGARYIAFMLPKK